jgi:hypothetical protein
MGSLFSYSKYSTVVYVQLLLSPVQQMEETCLANAVRVGCGQRAIILLNPCVWAREEKYSLVYPFTYRQRCS